MSLCKRIAVLVLALTLAGSVGLACNPGADAAADAFIVPPDKTDNFLSLTAQEYMVEGVTTVTIEADLAGADEETKLKRVRELIPLQQVVIGWFLNSYVAPHDSHSESEYGGFDCLTKNGSYEDLEITASGDGLTYSFKFRQELGGTLDLLEKLPTELGEDGRRYFDLTIGKIANDEMAELETNNEWYRSAPWSEFDPSKVDPGRLDTVRLAIWAEPRSVDAWIDYARLFADGQVSIAIHFGWDYHNAYHIVHSEEVYDWLLARGFKSPVDAYDDYTRTSGPLTRTIQADGRPVEVRVWLFWGKPGTDTDPDTAAGGMQLEEDMRGSFRDREVIVFSGHSGPFYGFALANWRMTDEGDLDDSELPFLDMPAGTYQVVLAEGCETYGMGQGFWDNPNKADRSALDILTTTSFSNAAGADTVTDFLSAIAGTGYGDDVHQAKTFRELLSDLGSNSYWFNTMYGVHGLDDNPHLHPYADPALFCSPCKRDSDCGAQGYKCAGLESGEKACFGRCTADDGCPSGYKCMDVASGYTMQWKACVPNNLTCEVAPEEPDLPTVMINEVLADPPADLLGDANGDGLRHSSDDEFVELYNHGDHLVNLGGWMLADNTGTRFIFPAGVTLMAGEALVVFGGGEPAGSFGGSLAFTTDNMLGLNNSGDTITLVAADKTVVDSLNYSASLGGADCSMVRAQDGDPKASWVRHSDFGSPYSAGTRADGSSF